MIQAMFKRVAGLDVHLKTVVVTILMETEEGQIKETTKEFRTFAKDLESLAQWLKAEAIELAVMESTGIYWKKPYSVLEEHGIKTFVVNARHVKQVPGRKTDVKDSQWLASLARFGLLKSSFIPEKLLRELRLLSHYRKKLTEILASEKNRIHKVLDEAGVRLHEVVTDINSLSGQDIIAKLIEGEINEDLSKYLRGRAKTKKDLVKDAVDVKLSDNHRFTLQMIREHIKYLEKELAIIDDKIYKGIEPYNEQWQLLQTIPGINAIIAALIIIEIGVDMRRFGDREQFCSWAGMCPGNNESAGRKKSSKTRKGNKMLRTILCEAAYAAVKTNSQFKGKYRGLVIRRGSKRAIVAIGHKILRVIHCVLNKHRPYFDPTISYESLVTHKNAARWMRSLKKFGYLPQYSVAV